MENIFVLAGYNADLQDQDLHQLQEQVFWADYLNEQLETWYDTKGWVHG